MAFWVRLVERGSWQSQLGVPANFANRIKKQEQGLAEGYWGLVDSKEELNMQTLGRRNQPASGVLAPGTQGVQVPREAPTCWIQWISSLTQDSRKRSPEWPRLWPGS